MKNKKLCLCGLLILVFLFLFGCGKEEEAGKEADYYIYYINKNETAIVSEGYEPEKREIHELVKEFLAKLQEKPENTDYKCPLPESVKLLEYELENGQLYLYFDAGYHQMEKVYEVLCRAAIVRTVCQLPGIDYVAFFVNDQLLLDSNQSPVGMMNAELFIENAGDQINTYNSVTLNLYFSNETGERLLKERDTFNYSTNLSIEKLVVEQLIKGPVSEYTYPCIPPETKVLNITTKDGTCYVNLDGGFLEQGYDVAEAIPIYAIVNSLVELQNINRIQILINGETPKVYREKISFETIFERNMELVDMKETTETTETTEDTEEMSN